MSAGFDLERSCLFWYFWDHLCT